MTDTAGRLLTMLGLLQSGRSRSGRELAHRLSVTDRCVRRDIERLRALGYPIESANGREGGYRLTSGRTLPPLVFDDASAVAVAVALRIAAGTGVDGLGEHALRALAVIDQVLPKHLRADVTALTASTSALPRGSETVDPAVLLELARAVHREVRVRFAYRDKSGAATDRDVEPRHVVSMHGRWYLMAYDLRRDDWRTFRLDRVEEPSLHVTTFASQPRHAPDPAEYIRASIHRTDTPRDARIRVGMPASELRPRIPDYAGTVAADGPCRCVLTARAEDPEWLAFHLARLDVPIAVLEPESLRAVMLRMARKLERAAEHSA